MATFRIYYTKPRVERIYKELREYYPELPKTLGDDDEYNDKIVSDVYKAITLIHDPSEEISLKVYLVFLLCFLKDHSDEYKKHASKAYDYWAMSFYNLWDLGENPPRGKGSTYLYIDLCCMAVTMYKCIAVETGEYLFSTTSKKYPKNVKGFLKYAETKLMKSYAYNSTFAIQPPEALFLVLYLDIKDTRNETSLVDKSSMQRLIFSLYIYYQKLSHDILEHIPPEWQSDNLLGEGSA